MSGTYIWATDRIRLRAVTVEDWPTHWEWNRNSAMVRSVDRLYFPQTAGAAFRWAERTANKDPEGDRFEFEIETLDGVFLGHISTHDCDVRYGTFSYGVAIQDEHQRKGYASEAIGLVLRYYFHELRYQKVTVEIYEFNTASLNLHERLGFVREGQLRRMVFTDGKFYDKLFFGLTADEFTAKQP